MSATPPTAVHHVGFDALGSVLNTLTLAFATDPIVRYAFPRPDGYLAGYPAMVEAMAGQGAAAGGAWLTEDGSAAALWRPPGIEPDDAGVGAALAAHAARHRMETLGEFGAEIDRYHPTAPHWYLCMLGVDPSRQGQGLGSAVLKAGLRRCDEDGLIAYLESSHPRNIPLYERHGFEVMGVIQTRDMPPFYPMIRQARRA